MYNLIFKQADKIHQEKQVRNFADLALLSQGMLKGEYLTAFIKRSIELMNGSVEK
jgi:molecular chaperone HtpG